MTRWAAGAKTAKSSTPSSHHRMGAQLLVEMHMPAFAEQVEIEIG
jgi:hypothetical protein